MKAIKLPKKPSALIKLALTDLYAVEKDPRYIIEMGRWHEPTVDAEGQPICAVCLAGSVMARRGHCNTTTSINFWKIPKSNRAQMTALNAFRESDIVGALNDLGINSLDHPRWVNDIRITAYEESPRSFKREMRTLAARLERAGL